MSVVDTLEKLMNEEIIQINKNQEPTADSIVFGNDEEQFVVKRRREIKISPIRNSTINEKDIIRRINSNEFERTDNDIGHDRELYSRRQYKGI